MGLQTQFWKCFYTARFALKFYRIHLVLIKKKQDPENRSEYPLEWVKKNKQIWTTPGFQGNIEI